MSRVALFIALLCLFSCSGEQAGFGGKNFEGKITYKVTYPENNSDPLHDLYPDELVVYFHDGEAIGILESLGFYSKFFLDTSEEEYQHYISFIYPPEKYQVVINQDNWDNQSFPMLNFEKTKKKMKIADQDCRELVAKDDSGNVVQTIWMADDIAFEGANSVGPYKGINNVLLSYDYSQFGMKAHLEAIQVEHTLPGDSEFQKPSNHREISESDLVAYIDSTYRGNQ